MITVMFANQNEFLFIFEPYLRPKGQNLLKGKTILSLGSVLLPQLCGLNIWFRQSEPTA